MLKCLWGVGVVFRWDDIPPQLECWLLGWSEKNFLFQINFSGVKKVGIWSENMFKSGFARLQAKIPCYLPLVVCPT